MNIKLTVSADHSVATIHPSVCGGREWSITPVDIRSFTFVLASRKEVKAPALKMLFDKSAKAPGKKKVQRC